MLVLGLSVIVTIIALGAIAVSRVQARSTVASQDFSEAQSLAISAVDHALAEIDRTSNWRSTYDRQTVSKPLSRGTFTWRLADETDGDLTDDGTDPFTVFATGTVGGASYSLRASMTMPLAQMVNGISALDTFTADDSTIDSWDSSDGPYGGPRVTAEARVAANSTAPGGVSLIFGSQINGSLFVGSGGDPNTVLSKDGSSGISGTVGALYDSLATPAYSAPTGMGPSLGDRTYTGGGSPSINGNLHVDDLTIESKNPVRIMADVIILAEGDVDILNSSGITVQPGASLTLYFRGKLKVRDDAELRVLGSNLSRLTLINLGTGTVELSGSGSSAEGVIISPGGDVQLSGGFDMCGAVLGKNISLTTGSAIHEDKRITGLTDPVTLPGTARPRPASWNRVVD